MPSILGKGRIQTHVLTEHGHAYEQQNEADHDPDVQAKPIQGALGQAMCGHVSHQQEQQQERPNRMQEGARDGAKQQDQALFRTGAFDLQHPSKVERNQGEGEHGRPTAVQNFGEDPHGEHHGKDALAASTVAVQGRTHAKQQGHEAELTNGKADALQRQPGDVRKKSQHGGQARRVEPAVPRGRHKGASFRKMMRQRGETDPVHALWRVRDQHRQQGKQRDEASKPHPRLSTLGAEPSITFRNRR